jgi:hypothetical protein
MSLGSNLKRLTESHSPREATELFGQALASGKIDARTVSTADLCEAFLGRSKTEQARKLLQIKENAVHLMEASEAIDASTFSNITGQLLVTEIKKGYEAPQFIADRLMRTIPNPGGNLGTHKIIGLSDVLDKPDKLEQLQPYPQTKFNETWVTMPAPERRGMICAISLEMMLSDLTGQAQERASSIGKAARYQKEERQLRVVLGLDNPYVWNGVSLNTYAATAGTGNYVNLLLSETITNYTHINDVELVFRHMVDPITGRHIDVQPTQILCMPAKRYDLKRILNATEVRDATSGIHDVTANPLDTNYPILTSAIAEQLLLDSGLTSSQVKERVYFLAGDRAFFYRELLPFSTVNAPANNPMEFHQDVVFAIKCSEFGVPGVYDARFAVQSRSEAS